MLDLSKCSTEKLKSLRNSISGDIDNNLQAISYLDKKMKEYASLIKNPEDYSPEILEREHGRFKEQKDGILELLSKKQEQLAEVQRHIAARELIRGGGKN